MGFLAILSIYIKEMLFSILAVFGIDKSSGNYMQVVYIAMTALCVLTFLYQMMFKLSISKNEIGMIFAFGFLLVAFAFIPRVFYRNAGSVYQAQLLTAFSSVLSAFLMGILAKRGNFINAMAKAVPWFVIINTFSSTLVAFTSSGTTSGGYLKDASGFNYQDLSYFIAFTFALNVFYIKNQHKIEGNSIFKRPGWNTFFQCLIPVHLLTVMLAGGRGAFVLVGILSIYYFIMDSSNLGKNVKNFILMFIAVAVLFMILPSANLEYSGFERILGLLSGSGDASRADLRSKALQAFLDNPIFGNGSGSVFVFTITYSHNIFTDIMAEYGILGLIIISVILIKLVKKLFGSVRKNPCNHLIVVIFIGCFLHLSFSGYYLGSPSFWFVLGYSFSSDSENPQSKKFISKYVKIH